MSNTSLAVHMVHIHMIVTHIRMFCMIIVLRLSMIFISGQQQNDHITNSHQCVEAINNFQKQIHDNLSGKDHVNNNCGRKKVLFRF